MDHRTLLIAFSPTDPRCYGNEIWDKIGYNSACVREFCEIFAPIDGLTWMGHRMLPIAPPTDLRCHGNEIWDKIGYNSVRVKDFGEILRLYDGSFRGWAIECITA